MPKGKFVKIQYLKGQDIFYFWSYRHANFELKTLKVLCPFLNGLHWHIMPLIQHIMPHRTQLLTVFFLSFLWQDTSKRHIHSWCPENIVQTLIKHKGTETSWSSHFLNIFLIKCLVAQPLITTDCFLNKAFESESESERALLPSVFAHTRNVSWC